MSFSNTLNLGKLSRKGFIIELSKVIVVWLLKLPFIPISFIAVLGIVSLVVGVVFEVLLQLVKMILTEVVQIQTEVKTFFNMVDILKQVEDRFQNNYIAQRKTIG